jgi:hypothetical protein
VTIGAIDDGAADRREEGRPESGWQRRTGRAARPNRSGGTRAHDSATDCIQVPISEITGRRGRAGRYDGEARA